MVQGRDIGFRARPPLRFHQLIRRSVVPPLCLLILGPPLLHRTCRTSTTPPVSVPLLPVVPVLRLCTLPIEFVLLLRLRRALSVRLSVVPTAQRCALLNSLAVGVGKRCAPLIVPCSPAITLRTCKVVSPGVLWIVSRTLSLASSLRVAVLIGATIGRISLSLLESSPTRTSFQ